MQRDSRYALVAKQIIRSIKVVDLRLKIMVHLVVVQRCSGDQLIRIPPTQNMSQVQWLLKELHQLIQQTETVVKVFQQRVEQLL